VIAIIAAPIGLLLAAGRMAQDPQSRVNGEPFGTEAVWSAIAEILAVVAQFAPGRDRRRHGVAEREQDVGLREEVMRVIERRPMPDDERDAIEALDRLANGQIAGALARSRLPLRRDL
jgi:hypothetical protein